MAGVTAARKQAWARGFGVALYAMDRGDLDAPGIERALRDGVERGYDGELPAAPEHIECFAIRKGGAVVGVLAFVRDLPRAGQVTIWGVAIAPPERGHAYGARALFAAERRLRREGMRELLARVPRTNGRGLYFMLRCGYAPVVAPVEDGATWFRRNLKPAGRSAVGRARGPRPTRRGARESSAGS
jgi:GNAT superfamily N-acetyltransferase